MAGLAIGKQNLVSLKLIAYDFFKTGCCKRLSCAYVLRSVEANPVFFCIPSGGYKMGVCLFLFEMSMNGELFVLND